MKRRTFLISTASLAVAGVAPARADAPRELRIGYQKTAIPLVVKAQKRLKQRFEPQGVAVKWVEFAFGPPLLEAVNAGAVDYGYTATRRRSSPRPPTPRSPMSPSSRRVVTARRSSSPPIRRPKLSPISRARRLASPRVERPQSARLGAQEREIAWTDIEPVYLAPADAASAFSRGAIDAWSIWDPFFAIAELKQKARPLPIDPKATVQNSFFLANRDFLAKHADVVAAVNEEIAKATTWAGDHRDEVAALFAEASGVDLEAQKRRSIAPNSVSGR